MQGKCRLLRRTGCRQLARSGVRRSLPRSNPLSRGRLPIVDGSTVDRGAKAPRAGEPVSEPRRALEGPAGRLVEQRAAARPPRSIGGRGSRPCRPARARAAAGRSRAGSARPRRARSPAPCGRWWRRRRRSRPAAWRPGRAPGAVVREGDHAPARRRPSPGCDAERDPLVAVHEAAIVVVLDHHHRRAGRAARRRRRRIRSSSRRAARRAPSLIRSAPAGPTRVTVRRRARRWRSRRPRASASPAGSSRSPSSRRARGAGSRRHGAPARRAGRTSGR